MNTLLKKILNININYLDIEKTSEINLIIEDKFAKLRQVCARISSHLKLANIARHRKTATNYSYLISIGLNLPERIGLYALRLPQSIEDSIEKAIAEVFAKIYRKLIELQLGNHQVVYK